MCADQADKSPIPGEMGIHELQQLPGEMSSKAVTDGRLWDGLGSKEWIVNCGPV